MIASHQVRIPIGDDILAGTLHMPSGPGPHPALVMLQGSGPDDRDSNGYFPPIRDLFLDVGLAVLSWDKLGVGESTGDWHRQTFFDRSDEALAALDWLRARDDIDATRTGIWGHSQGGWVGPLTAARDARMAFLIVNSGPGVSVLEQDLYGVEHTLRHDGGSDTDVRQAVTYMDGIHAAAEEAMPYHQFVTRIMEPARGTSGFDYFGEVDEGLWMFLVLNLQHPYDPVSSLERITCPVLAIFGERDVLVPVERSVNIFKDALASARNNDFTIKVFPDADHRICVGDPPQFADGYLETMSRWLRDRMR